MNNPFTDGEPSQGKSSGVNPEPTRQQLKQRIKELERERDTYRWRALEASTRGNYLESALHQAPDALVTLNAAQRVVDWNLGAQKLFGYSRNEARGKDLDELINGPEAHEHALTKSRKLLSRHTMKAVETVRYRKDGTPVRVVVSSSPISQDGALRGVVVVYTDITERKRNEETLKRREKNCRAFLNKAPVGMYQSETERMPLYMNPEMAAILGAASARQALDHYRDLESDLYVNQQRRWDLIALLRRDGEVRGFEFRARRMDGGPIWLSLNARILKRRSEDDFVVDGFVTEVTERKRAEQAVTRTCQEQARLLDLAPVQLWRHTDVDTYGTSNRAHAEFLGHSPEELEHRQLEEFFPREEAQDHRRDNAAVFESGQEVHSEGWARDAHGESRYLSLSRIPELDAENGVQGIVCAASDITGRKQQEERLKETSFYDPFTGLYTRAFFEEEIRRLGTDRFCPLGIIVCHIEGLESATENRERPAGGEDTAVAAAGILRRCFRASDILARIGEDAFAVLLPFVSEDILRKCRDRIDREVERHHQNDDAAAMFLWTGSSVTYGPPVDGGELFRRAEESARKKRIGESLSPEVGEADTELLGIQMARDRTAKCHGEPESLRSYALALGDALNLSGARRDNLNLLTRFRDLGLVGVPDRILFKQHGLGLEEFRIMKRHCETGRRIALSSSTLTPLAELIHKHHEWWDGLGYPLGLKGRTIPLECRILSVAEAFEALTADPAEGEAMSREEAIRELRRSAGTLLDPDLVETFVSVLEEM